MRSEHVAIFKQQILNLFMCNSKITRYLGITQNYNYCKTSSVFKQKQLFIKKVLF